MGKLKDWFYGRVEIPGRVLYVAIITGFALYASCIVASLIMNN